ncbi:hypothetical protein ACM41_39905 [Bradyrhizobium sp. CCBAU 21362]|nr:hypothetical protein [Bradyrhizobium sp. CCBAU 21362]
MAYTVEASFNAFYEEINLSGDHRDTANKRRDRIVDLLKNDFTILEAYSAGSIPKYTALRGHADLDVIVALHYGKHVKDKLPSVVLQNVRDSLSAYRTGVRSNGQAVTLYYDTWPSVDIVPVSRVTDNNGTVTHCEVPNSRTESWIPSKPKEHAALIEAASTKCGPNFRRIIKMAKEWNRVHSDYLTGYHIEVLALRTFDSNLDDLPWHLHMFFDKARDFVRQRLWHQVSYVDDYLSATGRAEAVKRLETAYSKSLSAWYATHGSNKDHVTAIGLWRQIFGDRYPAHG